MLFAPGFEEVEAITIVDLLRRVEIAVDMISVSNTTGVIGAHRINITCDGLMDSYDFSQPQLLILPGGVPGVPNLESDRRVLKVVSDFYRDEKYIAAICAAPSVLDKSGVLTGDYTCYPGWKGKIKNGTYIDTSVVVNNRIITSQGLGTAIDLSLKLVELFVSKDESIKLKNAIIYR